MAAVAAAGVLMLQSLVAFAHLIVRNQKISAHDGGGGRSFGCGTAEEMARGIRALMKFGARLNAPREAGREGGGADRPS